MKTIRLILTAKLLALGILTTMMSLGMGQTVHSDSLNENIERLSEKSSRAFGPQYVNTDKVKLNAAIADGLIDKKNGIMEKAGAYFPAKPVKNISAIRAGTGKLTLQNKVGGSSNAKTTNFAAAPKGSVTVTDNYNINIQAGVLPHYEGQRMVSNYIDNVKHIYAGFEKNGFAQDGTTKPIQDAINKAKQGDVIIVAKGTYSGDITMEKGIKVFGGFGEDGKRDLAANSTLITGNVSVNTQGGARSDNEKSELNGFSLSGARITVYGGSFALTNNYGTLGSLNINNSTCSINMGTGDLSLMGVNIGKGGSLGLSIAPGSGSIVSNSFALPDVVEVESQPSDSNSKYELDNVQLVRSFGHWVNGSIDSKYINTAQFRSYEEEEPEEGKRVNYSAFDKNNSRRIDELQQRVMY